MGKVAGLAAAALLLAACGSVPGERQDPHRVVGSGWYEPIYPQLADRHCYRTLARVDCHGRPLSDEENRRVDWFDAPIAD